MAKIGYHTFRKPKKNNQGKRFYYGEIRIRHVANGIMKQAGEIAPVIIKSILKLEDGKPVPPASAVTDIHPDTGGKISVLNGPGPLSGSGASSGRHREYPTGHPGETAFD
jgi:hypothetical protein